MPSDLDNLLAARSAHYATLAEMAANPLTTYSSDGKSYDFNGMRRQILAEITAINQQIGIAEGVWDADTLGR